MPRATWSGSVSFGLVNVPVKLYTAVRERRVRFHQIERETGSRIRYRKVSEQSGEEVPPEDIVKGFEISPGEYVPIAEEELDSAAPEASRAIEIEDFVDLSEIEPAYFDRTYYLEPDGQGAGKPYSLLLQTMQRTGRVAIGRFVMRSRQHLAALRPVDGALALETMHFPDEMLDTEDLNLPAEADLSDRELRAAEQLVESLTTDWEPERYRDTHRERVMEIIERKAEGQEVLAEPVADEGAEVVDLMSALEASLEGRRGRRAEVPDELESLTKDELYDLARKADVEGRSEMSKQDLIEALKARTAPENRRTA